jgi:hypothetical protein
VQVVGTVVRKPARTWRNRGVAQAGLALVHASGALQPLTFLNIDFTVPELEYLAALITAHARHCNGGGATVRSANGSAAANGHAGGDAGEVDGVDNAESSAWDGQESENGRAQGQQAAGAVAVENDVEVSPLVDIFRTPGFGGGADAPVATAGATASQPFDAQQRAVLARMSAWDSEGAALLRAAPRLAACARASATHTGSNSGDRGESLRVALRPSVAVSSIRLVGWAVAFAIALVLLEAVFLEAIDEEADEYNEGDISYKEEYTVRLSLMLCLRFGQLQTSLEASGVSYNEEHWVRYTARVPSVTAADMLCLRFALDKPGSCARPLERTVALGPCVVDCILCMGDALRWKNQ